MGLSLCARKSVRLCVCENERAGEDVRGRASERTMNRTEGTYLCVTDTYNSINRNVHLYAYIRTIRIHICIYIYICKYECMYRPHTHIQTHAYVHKFTQARAKTHTHTYIYIYIYVYI